MFILKDGRYHHDYDHNMKAAYLHVLADALTSVLTIAALLTGKYMGIVWIDPVMVIVGVIVIFHWYYGLIKESSSVLSDKSVDV
ncbi:cation transporter [Psychrobacter sp. ASPA161_9]|uniref:cation transporter n=1 Tax=Psychrobacter sp. ASPA161_9 TaxID=3160961 RepID=UPI003F7E7C1C